jgi:hypothetical protein
MVSDLLTRNPFFSHNLCLKCPNGSCKLILETYVLIAFQWYKELLNPLSFNSYNCSLKIWESTGTPTPKVEAPLGVWGFVPSHFLTFPITISNHYYKMWVQFTSPCSLDQWIHYFSTNPRSLQPMNSLKIQWNWRTRTLFVVVNYMHFTFYCAWSMTHVITSHIHLPISNWTSL